MTFDYLLSVLKWYCLYKHHLYKFPPQFTSLSYGPQMNIVWDQVLFLPISLHDFIEVGYVSYLLCQESVWPPHLSSDLADSDLWSLTICRVTESLWNQSPQHLCCSNPDATGHRPDAADKTHHLSLFLLILSFPLLTILIMHPVFLSVCFTVILGFLSLLATTKKK